MKMRRFAWLMTAAIVLQTVLSPVMSMSTVYAAPNTESVEETSSPDDAANASETGSEDDQDGLVIRTDRRRQMRNRLRVKIRTLPYQMMRQQMNHH